MRAVVEVSNFCRGNRHCCGAHRDNAALDRYRVGLVEPLERHASPQAGAAVAGEGK